MDQIETRLRDAKMGAAIDNTAGGLPEGWVLAVNIEKGCAWLTLTDPDGNDVWVDQSEDMSNDINNAVAIANESNHKDHNEPPASLRNTRT